MPQGADWTMHPGEHWAEAIAEMGITQADVAACIGCSQQFLSNVIRGHRLPGVELVIKFGGLMHPDDDEDAERAARLLWRVNADYVLDVALGKKQV